MELQFAYIFSFFILLNCFLFGFFSLLFPFHFSLDSCIFSSLIFFLLQCSKWCLAYPGNFEFHYSISRLQKFLFVKFFGFCLMFITQVCMIIFSFIYLSIFISALKSNSIYIIISVILELFQLIYLLPNLGSYFSASWHYWMSLMLLSYGFGCLCFKHCFLFPHRQFFISK